MKEQELREQVEQTLYKHITSFQAVSYEDTTDALIQLITQYGETREREGRKEELSSLLKTTNYDDVPLFVGVVATFIIERMIALDTKHNWKDNDTWSVFTCNKCGYKAFSPNPLPEYGCNGGGYTELKEEV